MKVRLTVDAIELVGIPPAHRKVVIRQVIASLEAALSAHADAIRPSNAVEHRARSHRPADLAAAVAHALTGGRHGV